MARQFPPRPLRETEPSPQPQSTPPASVNPSPYAPPGSDARRADTALNVPSYTAPNPGTTSAINSATNVAPAAGAGDLYALAYPIATPTPLPFAPIYDPLDSVLAAEMREAPSLPIILVSAAIGVVAGVATYFLASEVAGVRMELSIGLAVLALCFGLGATGGVLSAATGSRAAVPNILFSCGVILLILFFFGICTFAGALGATLLLFLQG